MQGEERTLVAFLYCGFHASCEVIEEKRVNYLVYVFNGGVHHAARAAGDGVERRFKERTENGWGYVAPVELRRADEELAEVVRNRGNVVERM